MIELVVTKTVNTAHFGPIEPGCVLVVPEHLAKRLVSAGYAGVRVAPEPEPDCGGGDGGIITEVVDSEEE